MNGGDTIVAVISVAACMVLAMRGLRARRMSFERTAALAVAWVVIIAVLAFVLQRYAS
jgi:hypothetical protein